MIPFSKPGGILLKGLIVTVYSGAVLFYCGPLLLEGWKLGYYVDFGPGLTIAVLVFPWTGLVQMRRAS